MNPKRSWGLAVCLSMGLLLTFGVIPAFSQTAPAAKTGAANDAPLPTEDQIAEKCAKGSGGKEAWSKLSTQVLTGTIEIAAAGITGKIEIIAKAPNKLTHTITLAEGRFIEKQGFDGKVAWKFDSQQGLKKLEGAELEQTKIDSVFDSEVRFKEVHPDMKVTGRAKVGDRDAYTVLIHGPGGRAQTIYFDAETGLRIAEDAEGPDETGKIEKTHLLFEDYRVVNGVKLPFRLQIESSAGTFVIKVDDVKHNVPVDESVFSMPAENPAAAQ